MTIGNFVDLMVDSSFFDIEIYSCSRGEVLFNGRADELPEEFLDTEIASIDSPINCSLCVNID